MKGVSNTSELYGALLDTFIHHIRLDAGLNYELSPNQTASVFASLCSQPRQAITIEVARYAGTSLESHVSFSQSEGVLEIACLVRLVNVQLNTNSHLRVTAEGTLMLVGEARIKGEVEIIGPVRYEMPAPLGTFVPAGVPHNCSELEAGLCSHGDATFVELAAPNVIHDLPQLCMTGFFGNSTSIDAQRSPSCSGACPKAHFCPEGSKSPLPCPGGTYGSVKGLPSSGACEACLPGHECPTGVTAPQPCVVGTYQPAAGQMNCTTCDKDKQQYCLNEGMVQFDGVPCNTGLGGSDAEFRDSDDTCKVCPIGSACDGGKRKRCPPGSHSWHEGESYCTLCRPGGWVRTSLSLP